MLDQEIASIMTFLIEASGNPYPYYYNIPEKFLTPAIFFPQPEISSRGATLNTYALEFSWFVKFFDKDTQSAHALAFAALTALQVNSNVVPLIEPDGTKLRRSFRLADPSLRVADDGAVQLTLTWDSARPYAQDDLVYVREFHANVWLKSAFTNAVGQKRGPKYG